MVRGAMRSENRIVVADAEDRAALIAGSLGREGFHVDVAANDEQLTRLLVERLSLAVVASEFGRGGPSAAMQVPRMRREAHLRQLPVIVLCEENNPEDRLAAFEGGADAYLVKPISIRELVLRVRAILRREGDADRTKCTFAERARQKGTLTGQRDADRTKCTFAERARQKGTLTGQSVLGHRAASK